MQSKILIIKLGYSETLDPEIGKVASLGDVLRTTPILWAIKEKFTDSHVTWLVSAHAEPLLKGNPLIDRLLVWDEFVPFQLLRERLDILINLEKIPGVAALSDMIDAWTKYGFRFDSTQGDYHTYERGFAFLHYIERKKSGQIVGDYWQKLLIEMLGGEWRGQEYLLGYRPTTTETCDIGLNYMVGSKWPTKAMPLAEWQALEKLLTSMGYSVSWQQGLEDINCYMDWINSCATIISQDSLGIHLALALKKHVIGLFGPTDPQEVYLYDRGEIIFPDLSCPRMPCYGFRCLTGAECMKHLNITKIAEAARRGRRAVA